MTQKRWLPAALLLLLITVLAAGCGKDEAKADVSVFFMNKEGTSTENAVKLQESLIALVGPAPSISISTSPIFSAEKMIVELGYGGHGIFILPEEQFKNFAKSGSFLSLDEHFKPEDYSEGIVEAEIQPPDGQKVDKNAPPKMEKHLYGIPLKHSKWFKDNGFNGSGLVAFMAENSRNPELSLEVLKKIAGK
ncbi:hypothetical protein [Paenibacillus lutrae]|uniref:Lipoprotein n=1 Tax=Paenibacillus lutrae TaxID=2078573 RepID=A0A7X3FFW5_9BACL|nr:hypothetical protein [Paenibacillus lutrae]MVO98954.1 hypothetical protein [Paenibacillus lutrae]